jgi:hypothetical protein
VLASSRDWHGSSLSSEAGLLGYDERVALICGERCQLAPELSTPLLADGQHGSEDRGVFHNVTELENAIHEWIEHRNQDPKPFTWTAGPNPSSPPIAEPKKPWPSRQRANE